MLRKQDNPNLRIKYKYNTNDTNYKIIKICFVTKINKIDSSTQLNKHKQRNIFIFNKTKKSEKEKTLWLSVIIIGSIIFLIWIIKVVYNIKTTF